MNAAAGIYLGGLPVASETLSAVLPCELAAGAPEYLSAQIYRINGRGLYMQLQYSRIPTFIWIKREQGYTFILRYPYRVTLIQRSLQNYYNFKMQSF